MKPMGLKKIIAVARGHSCCVWYGYLSSIISHTVHRDVDPCLVQGHEKSTRVALAGETMQSSLPKAAFKVATFLACSVTAVSFCMEGLADTKNGSNVVKFDFTKRTSSGEVSACELDFAAIGADSYYKSPPGLVLVSGSWYFMMRDDGHPVASLKVCGMDVVDVESQSLRQFTVKYAYPILKGNSLHDVENAQKVIGDCSVSGYMEPSLSRIVRLINARDFQIAYTRKVGGQDVYIRFTFNPENYSRSADAIIQWTECSAILMEGIDHAK
jgi:hypothetical protein